MSLAERLSTFGEEALALQVLVAFRAFEALAVIVVVKSFNPSVTSLYGEAAANTLCRKQVVPVSLAVWQAVFQIEGTRSEDLPTVGAAEAFRMELLAYCIEAITLHPLVTLSADRGEVLLVAVFAVERSLLLHEAHVNEWLPAAFGGADEVVGTPSLS